MIGIVVVSHSRSLAEAAVALAAAMITGDEAPRIGIAAGVTGPDGAGGAVVLGTDAMAVAAAIGDADSPDGVLVLMDLGSAVMSAQLAVEFLDEELAGRVRLCPAPLVEGLVAAVAAAASGASLVRAAEQAEAGLAAKQELIGRADPVTAPASSTPASTTSAPTTSASVTREVLVSSPIGLHLRPASLLAGLVASYDAEVLVSDTEAGRGPVPGDSLTDLLTLGAVQGHHLHLEASGPQARAVLDAIEALAAKGFGDEPASTPEVGGQAAASSSPGHDSATKSATFRSPR